MITAFPKIFAIGTDYIRTIFEEDVQITEKIDGSQFGFGKVDDKVFIRSKGATLYFEHPNKMFLKGILHIEKIADKIPNNMVFYAEYLKDPKHNILKYDRVPKNNLMLFAAMDITQKFHQNTEEYAELFDIEHVPIIFNGKINNMDELKAIIDKESVLGGAKMEGIVAKNFSKQFLLGGQPIPIMAGKFVSEAFKEVHRDKWRKENTGKGRLETFFESFKTEARWEKAIQHLKEADSLENTPRDIGIILKEIHLDIENEEKEMVKSWLWHEFSHMLKREATKGFPEWYKERLMKRSFEED